MNTQLMPSVVDTSAQVKALACTNLRVRQLMRRVSHHYDVEMAQAGLKTTQYSLLSHVYKLGPLRQGDLARAMKISASTLTRNLQPLVDLGWLALAAGSDARSRNVTITPTGRAKREEARQLWRVAQDNLTQRLGAQRVLALHALIDESLDLLGMQDAPGVRDE
jgi:DNA-binding MarR family transcriptional regulator